MNVFNPLGHTVGELICKNECSEKLSSFNETQLGCTADCHVGCPEGTYRLPGMVECKPRLNCEQIRSLTKDRNLIGGGGVKRVSFVLLKHFLRSIYCAFPNVSQVYELIFQIKCLPTHLIFGTVKNITSVFYRTKN